MVLSQRVREHPQDQNKTNKRWLIARKKWIRRSKIIKKTIKISNQKIKSRCRRVKEAIIRKIPPTIKEEPAENLKWCRKK
jgi:hypothetical protein